MPVGGRCLRLNIAANYAKRRCRTGRGSYTYTCERRCQCPRLSNHTLGSSHTVLGRGCAPGVNINLPCVNGAPLMRSAIEMRIPFNYQFINDVTKHGVDTNVSSNGKALSIKLLTGCMHRNRSPNLQKKERRWYGCGWDLGGRDSPQKGVRPIL